MRMPSMSWHGCFRCCGHAVVAGWPTAKYADGFNDYVILIHSLKYCSFQISISKLPKVCLHVCPAASFLRSTTHTLCAIMLLTMAETMRLHYARCPPEDLQVGAGGIGYHTVRIIFTIPVLGVIAIRVIDIFTVSQSILLAICITIISTMPGGILPTVMYFFRRARHWVGRSEREEGDGVEMAPLPEQTISHEGRFMSTEATLRSIFDTICITMQSIVEKGVALVLLLRSVCTIIDLVVTPAVGFLERIMIAVHHQLRCRGHPRRGQDETGLEEMLA
ncbi:hypothetical protein J3A83DRAFT_4199563 [Scleroderma citrinum]